MTRVEKFGLGFVLFDTFIINSLYLSKIYNEHICDVHYFFNMLWHKHHGLSFVYSTLRVGTLHEKYSINKHYY